MNDKYKIESGVKLHDPVRSERYPFSQMEIGDSFFVPVADAPTQQIQCRIQFFKRKNPGWEFCLRKAEGGCRVWRIQPKTNPALLTVLKP